MGREKDMEEKRYRIIGTAGHIDHGKTWLVKALTGTDTDRLAEEKRRGITIENGFAFLKFPDGREAGIIDVPGHERFIKNMLAGAGGIDIAMVVIAVDEGVMPQTREHLAILSLLGIRKGVLVLTKGDLEWKKGLDQEIREFAEGTFLENADVVVTSAVDGRGIEELRRVLWKLCTAGKTTENQNLSRNESDSCTGRMGTKASAFRLPIDRVFSLKGFGTVVTGTLLDGSLGLDYDAMLYPRAERIKIRGIQVHGQEVSEAVPGQRVAVNLPGIGKEQISRLQLVCRTFLVPLEKGIDLQNEHRQTKRLRDIIIRSRFIAHNLIYLRIHSCQANHMNQTGLADPPDQIETTPVRQIHIADHKLWFLLLKQFPCFPNCPGVFDLVPLFFQCKLNPPIDTFLIFQQQNFRHVCLSLVCPNLLLFCSPQRQKSWDAVFMQIALTIGVLI